MKIRITSEPYAGRYVGPIVSGLRTDPALIADREIVPPESPYALYVQEEFATRFVEPKAIRVQVEIKNLGLNSALVP